MSAQPAKKTEAAFQWKTSGHKIQVPKAEGAEGEWCITRRPGGWIIAERKRADGSIERIRFMGEEFRGKLSASLGGRTHFGEIPVKTRAHAGDPAGGGDSDLVAQFPGKVRKVLVAEGQEVAEGDRLMLLEAMKMEFAIKAPFAGIVKKLLVDEGAQLAPGARLVDLEPKANGEAN